MARRKQADQMIKKLEAVGVRVEIGTIVPYPPGHPTKPITYVYMLTFGTIRAHGQTLDLAVIDFVEKLLKAYGHLVVQKETSEERPLTERKSLVSNEDIISIDLGYVDPDVDPDVDH